jgi:hypothetical protein
MARFKHRGFITEKRKEFNYLPHFSVFTVIVED